MKFAFVTFSRPTSPIEDILAEAARWGYAGVEPRADGNQAHGVEVAASAAERSAIRDAAARAGVELCCLATSLVFADPEKAAEQTDHAHKRWIRCVD